jgi:hypothetical protein
MPTDNWGDAVVQDFLLACVQSPGNYTGLAAGRNVGYGSFVTAGASGAILGSTYAPQAAAAQRSIVSTSANDAAAGTGARTVLITYLNASMVLKTDTVTLNGTTAVNTNQTDIEFIESIVVATSGTDLLNDGSLNLMTGLAGAGSIMAQINASDATTYYAHHYIPAGVTCYMLKHTGSGTLAAGRVYPTHTGDPRTTAPLVQVGDTVLHLAGGSEDHEYKVPVPIPGPDRLVLRANPVSSVASNVEYASIDWVQF